MPPKSPNVYVKNTKAYEILHLDHLLKFDDKRQESIELCDGSQISQEYPIIRGSIKVSAQ